jgi:hypothetical protein
MTRLITDCRPQLIMSDMDLSPMCHGPTRIWMSSAVLHGKMRRIIRPRMTGVEEPVPGGPLQLSSAGSHAVTDLRDDYAGNYYKQSHCSHRRQRSLSGPRQCEVVYKRRCK